MWWKILIVTVGAYFLGSVNPAFLLGKALKGKDLTSEGTKNPGAANTWRELGKFWGIMVGVIDALKAVVPLAIGHALGFPGWVAVPIVVVAMIGHNWSIFLGGKGGAGFSIVLGSSLYLMPKEFAIAFGMFAVVFLITRLSATWKKYLPPMWGGTIIYFLVMFFLAFRWHEHLYLILLIGATGLMMMAKRIADALQHIMSLLRERQSQT
jgi:acyl-phosphate glycerol 3-phosphate acyltransferase